MKLDDIIDAIGDIKPEYIQEAESEGGEKKGFPVRRLWSRYRTGIAAAACFALLAGGMTALLHFGSGAEGGADGAAAGGVMESVGEGESMDSGTTNHIVINEISELSAAIYDIAEPDHVVNVNGEELEDHFGIRLFPSRLPDRLTFAGGEEQIYRLAYDEEEQVMDDNNCLEFSDEDGGRRFTVSARTVLAGEMIGYGNDRLEKSIVNETEVLIGHGGGFEEGTEFYIATYEKNGVYVTVQAENLTEDEMILILEGLLE